MNTYPCSYPFNGRRHVVHVDAVDEAEASRKLRAIGISAQIDGVLVMELPLYIPRAGCMDRIRKLMRGR